MCAGWNFCPALLEIVWTILNNVYITCKQREISFSKVIENKWLASHLYTASTMTVIYIIGRISVKVLDLRSRFTGKQFFCCLFGDLLTPYMTPYYDVKEKENVSMG